MNIYQGDPYITVSDNGADMTFNGGQPVMDRGLENAAVISVSSDKDWFGNVLFDDPNQQVNSSNYLSALKSAITLSSLNDARDGVEKDLQWMVDTGVASEINVDVNNNSGYSISSVITITPPGRDTLELQSTKNGNNWIFQKTNPAHERV